MDGDGSDELLIADAGELKAFDGRLRPVWSRSLNPASVEGIIPASPGRPALILADPMFGIDGATGQRKWAVASPMPRHHWNRGPRVLDAGGRGQMPLVLNTGDIATSCRSAVATDDRGICTPPAGTRIPPARTRDDPRWARPLPWTEPLADLIGINGFLTLAGVALLNVVLPIGIVAVAARRRPWTTRVLLALPVASAVPLAAVLTLEPLMPAHTGPLPRNPRFLLALGTLAGMPVVIYTGAVIARLVRRRWRSLAWLAVATVAFSAAIAAAWLMLDRRSMAAIEHYDRSSWYLAVVPGAYAVGALIPFVWLFTRFYRWLRRPPRGGIVTQ